MLTEIFEIIGYDIMPQSKFCIYPKISERTVWDNISDTVSCEVISAAEKYLGYTYPMLPASKYMRFVGDGNRTEFQEPYNERRDVLGMVFIAECIENKGRFLNAIIDGIYCICEETTWVLPAHNCRDRYYGDDFSALPLYDHGIIDLYSSKTAALLSTVYYCLKDVLEDISPEITALIERKIDFHILKPYMEYSDGFWMRETNNWNVRVNYQCLLTFMIMEKSDALRSDFLRKCVKSVDIYAEAYNDDGGCDEGPEYWTGSGAVMFRIAELLKYITYEKCDLFKIEKIKNIGTYLSKVNIYDNIFPAISDSDPELLSGFADIFNVGRILENKSLMRIAGIIEKKHHVYSDIDSVLLLDEIRAFDFDVQNDKFAGFSDLQLAVWREDGIFAAIKAGHNDESHNHNDVGSFVIYKNNKPVIIDVGAAPYTSKTFSQRRYEIWYTNSLYHNVPQIGGREQKAGREFAAKNFRCDENHYSADIGGAYADNIKWNRSVTFDRSERKIKFSEKYSIPEKQDIILAFITEEKPVTGDRCVILNEGVKLFFDGAEALVEEIIPEEEYLIKSWKSVYKLTLKFKGKDGTFDYEFRLG